MKDLAPFQTREVSVADAAAWSLSGSVSVCFQKTRAAGYAAALAAARKADRYAEGFFEGQLTHVAAFGASQEQIAMAIVVIRQIRGSKGLQVFGGGKFVQDVWRIEQVLDCVMTAHACKDPMAHCVMMLHESDVTASPNRTGGAITIRLTTEPELTIPADRYGLDRVGILKFPCRLLFERGFKFQEKHPSSQKEQLQAGSVRFGCDWCPHFRPETLAPA